MKAAGHDIEIPAQWVETPEGRFAHAIVLPPSIPKTVPFDFAMARLRALKPGGHSVARQYRDHLCSTEAGSFILKAVENVDGFFFRRPLHGATEDENNDRWKLEAPGVQAIWRLKDDPPDTAKMFVDPPSATYEWVEVRAENREIYRYSGLWSRESPPKVPPMFASAARYAIIWRGIRRERDREFAIAGVEWIALDVETNEVLGVLRDFYMTGLTRNRPNGVYWLNAGRCEYARPLFGAASELRETQLWVPMVLRPSVYPGVLKFLDEHVRGTK